jgi:predicted RNA-binding protein with EMAP domain
MLGALDFVTFVSKKDVEQAKDTRNAYGPRGWDKQTLVLDCASILKKST